MHDIANEEPTEEFVECWNAAVNHINVVSRDSNIGALRGDLDPPMLEHFSFRIGNQLFHIRVHDVAGEVIGPGALEGFRYLGEMTGGHLCVMWMEREGLKWKPVNNGWGLTRLDTGETVDPAWLVSDEKIPMSDWELQDFAVIRVKHELESKGLEVFSMLHWDAHLMPSIWFRSGDEVEWAVVRASRNPQKPYLDQDQFNQTKDHMASMGYPNGNFIAVSVAGENDSFDPNPNREPDAIYRGDGLFVKIEYPIVAKQ